MIVSGQHFWSHTHGQMSLMKLNGIDWDWHRLELVTDLTMRKLVQQSSLLHILDIHDHISISATTSGHHNVLVKGKRDEDHDDDQVDDGADGSHALRQLLLVVHLGHVAAPEAGANKGRAQPADHGVAGSKGEAAEGE